MSHLSGSVAVELHLDGAVIRNAVVNCRRPNVAQTLIGMTSEQALKRISILYALCPVAQQQAGERAMGKSVTLSSDAARLEWVKEHSWQCWLMLNDFCQVGDALTTTVALRKGDDRAAETLYGMAPCAWLSLSNKAALERWMTTSSAPYAQLLNMLYQREVRRFGTRVQANGPLRRCQEHAFIGFFAPECGELFMRTIARLTELALLLANQYQPPQARLLSDGLAEVEASRGRLTHQVTFQRGQKDEEIRSYQIVAPTDRHCERDGTLEKSLRGSELPNRDPIYAHLLAKAFDPCVPYNLTMEDHHA